VQLRDATAGEESGGHMGSCEAFPRGVVTPIVTFLEAPDGPIDRQAMKALVDFQVDNGVAGLLAAGSTGEVGNLSEDQHRGCIEAVVKASDGRIPVWGGVAGLGTSETVRSAVRAAEAGADAVLVLPPLFYDVSDHELRVHFDKVASAVDIPVVAYDVPPRTPRKMPYRLTASLIRDGIIAGVKDSSGDINSVRLLFSELDGHPAAVYLGTELLIDVAIQLGCTGTVPGFANLAPRACVEADRAAREGDWNTAQRHQLEIVRLFEMLFVPLEGASFTATALAAFKIATASSTGMGDERCAFPFVPADGRFRAAVEGILSSRRRT